MSSAGASFAVEGKKALIDFMAGRPMMAALHDAKFKEISGPGYNQGGIALKNPRSGLDETAAFLTWDNPTWNDASFTGARYLRIYDAQDLTTYGVIDFGADKSGQGADFIYKFPRAGGVIRI